MKIVVTILLAIAVVQTSALSTRERFEKFKIDYARNYEFLKNSVEELQQYSRRNNIRIFGIRETPNEDVDKLVLDLCKEKLNVDLNVTAIDLAHRVGKAQGGSRQIIVKFVSYQDRKKVFSNKKLLKGSGIRISEDIIKPRLEIFNAAQKKYRQENVWTVDGAIWVKTDDNKKHLIKTQRDLLKLEK